MSATGINFSGPGLGAGHSGQYITLAEALRQNVEEMEEGLSDLNQRGLSVSALQMEVSAVAIISPAGAICEPAANTSLAGAFWSGAFDAVERDACFEN